MRFKKIDEVVADRGFLNQTREGSYIRRDIPSARVQVIDAILRAM